MSSQPEDAHPPVVELRGISKRFPGVLANDRIDLQLRRGEIHVLLGENGAGKSTLMHILAGMCPRDAGDILVGGTPHALTRPAQARDAGIGMVYQHPSLVPEFTVVENMLLGRGAAFRLERARAMDELRRLAAGLGVKIDPDAVTGKLPPGRQQSVEIIKLLASGARILILDEPTSLLAPQETVELQRMLSALRADGLAIVLITHRLPEALSLADRVTVLRAGRVAAVIGPEELAASERASLQAQIVRAMFGEGAEELSEMAEMTGSGAAIGRARRRRPRGAAREGGAEAGVDGADARAGADHPGPVLLRVDGLTIYSRRQEVGLEGVSLEVHAGEVFGVAGVEGNGQRELAETLAGQRHPAKGSIWLGGEDITHAGVSERQRAGLRFVTDDRLGEGTVSSLPVSLNLLLKRVGERPFWSRGGRTVRAAVREAGAGLMCEFDIRAPGPDTPCGTLSGGNLQKVVLGRELSFAPRLVVYQNPTQGLDARTTASIRRRIRAMADAEGVAAVLISNDLDEVLALSDRVGVMWRGRLAGVVDAEADAVEEKIGVLMLGGSDGAAEGRGGS